MSLRVAEFSAEMKGRYIPFHSLHLLNTKRHTIMRKLYTRASQQLPPTPRILMVKPETSHVVQLTLRTIALVSKIRDSKR